MLGACVFVGDGQRRDLHHRAHAGHFENIRFVLDRGQFSGDGARGFDGRVEHTGNRDIHAEDRTAIALGWRVQSRERLADEPEGAAVLERRVGVERKLGGDGGKLAIRQTFSSRIDHETVVGLDHIGDETLLFLEQELQIRIEVGLLEPAYLSEVLG